MTPLTKYEQVTIINFNAGEQEAVVYTRDKTVMRRLDKLSKDYPDIYRIVESDELSKTYSMPKLCVSYRKPRALSEQWSVRVSVPR